MERVERTVFDLDSFEEVNLVKEVEYTPVTSIEEALAKLENDAAKLLDVLNSGLLEVVKNAAAEENDGWHTYDDEKPEEINGEFSGTIADMKAVNSLTLTLAKTVYGFAKGLPKSAKKAAKESARELIRTTDSIKDGLRKSAALAKK